MKAHLKSNNSAQERAQTLALQALTHILNHEDQLAGFMDLTGFGMDDFMALTPDLLNAALDYFLQNEELLLQFCGEHSIDPMMPMKAYRVLNPESMIP